jgi:hypothetical protein
LEPSKGIGLLVQVSAVSIGIQTSVQASTRIETTIDSSVREAMRIDLAIEALSQQVLTRLNALVIPAALVRVDSIAILLLEVIRTLAVLVTVAVVEVQEASVVGAPADITARKDAMRGDPRLADFGPDVDAWSSGPLLSKATPRIANISSNSATETRNTLCLRMSWPQFHRG